MIAFAMAAGWIAYAVGMYGYILVRGYNLSFWQVVSPTNYYHGTWPPPMAPNNVIFPNGQGGAGAGSTTTAATANKSPATTVGGLAVPSSVVANAAVGISQATSANSNPVVQNTVKQTGNPVAVQGSALAQTGQDLINLGKKILGLG